MIWRCDWKSAEQGLCNDPAVWVLMQKPALRGGVLFLACRCSRHCRLYDSENWTAFTPAVFERWWEARRVASALRGGTSPIPLKFT